MIDQIIIHISHQIISTPDLRIIDYGVGLPGSQHDATAWMETRIPNEHAQLLGHDEWVWGDSAYPLKNWCQAPYKKYFPLFASNDHILMHICVQA